MAKTFTTRQEAADYLKTGGFVYGLNGWKREDGFKAYIEETRRGRYSVRMAPPLTSSNGKDKLPSC